MSSFQRGLLILASPKCFPICAPVYLSALSSQVAGLKLINASQLWFPLLFQEGCQAMSIVIHYFITSCFSWCLVDSLFLYFNHMNSSHPLRKHVYYFLLGWGKYPVPSRIRDEPMVAILF